MHNLTWTDHLSPPFHALMNAPYYYLVYLLILACVSNTKTTLVLIYFKMRGEKISLVCGLSTNY